MLFVVLVCTGCYMLVTAASRLAATGNRLTRMLDYTGRHTMAIMLWHIPAFKLVILFQMWVCDYPPRYLGLPPGHPHRVALVVDTLHRGRNHPAAGLLPAVRPAHTIRSMVMSGFSRSRST